MTRLSNDKLFKTHGIEEGLSSRVTLPILQDREGISGSARTAVD